MKLSQHIAVSANGAEKALPLTAMEWTIMVTTYRQTPNTHKHIPLYWLFSI